MTGRSGEPRDSLFNPAKKNLRRKLWVAEEFTRRARGEPYTASAGEKPESSTRSMKPLDHPITLRMKTGCLDPVDSMNGANLRPTTPQM